MIRTAVIGASGYTGAELLRILSSHPEVELTELCAHSSAGKSVGEVLPSLGGLSARTLGAFDADRVASSSEVAFTALPHGASADIVASLRERKVVVFDLSADFRLNHAETYRKWYGEHGAPELFGTAVYGLVELARQRLRDADLIAVPGCYPTASILPSKPIVDLLAEPKQLLIDAKGGVSGAGRSASPRTHYSETAGGIRAYAIAGRHRHGPEIQQALGVPVMFNPHLVPMVRGILASVWFRPVEGVDAARCTEAARALYEGSPSVEVLEPESNPDTLWVRGSNRALISYTDQADGPWIVAQCAIDNLVKGAAGQAVQCFNVRFGFDEGLGLPDAAVWP